MLVVPVADAGRLASVCRLVGLDADVVPLARGGSAVVPLPVADAAGAAARLSRVLGRAEVLALVRTEGRVEATRWRRGRVVGSPAPGLVMSGVPDVVERLVLGDGDPSAEAGAVSSVGRAGHGPGRAVGPSGSAAWQRWDRVGTVVVLVVALVLAGSEAVAVSAGEGSRPVVALALLVAAWTSVRLLRRRP